MKLYEKRGRWCLRDKDGKLYKFFSYIEGLDFMEAQGMPVSSVERDESDEIEEEKSIAEKMKKAEATVTLDDLQGSYE